MLTGPATEILE